MKFLRNIVTSLFGTFIEIMKTCSILELQYLVNNYKKVFESIFAHQHLFQNKNIKDTFTNQFFIFIVRIEKKTTIEKVVTKNGVLLSPSLKNSGIS